jgi:hypothetical protein
VIILSVWSSGGRLARPIALLIVFFLISLTCNYRVDLILLTIVLFVSILWLS